MKNAAERLQAVRTARAGVLSDDNRDESVREPSGDGASPICDGGSSPEERGWSPGFLTLYFIWELGG